MPAALQIEQRPKSVCETEFASLAELSKNPRLAELLGKVLTFKVTGAL